VTRADAATVAIIGRPNVGKSTLFNRVVGGRSAIVDDRPGSTRDRHFGRAEWNGRGFWVVDTGGLLPRSDEPMDAAIRTQVELAVTAADVVVFLVDAQDGPTPGDAEIVEYLRAQGRPVLLVANKIDDLAATTSRFTRLDFPTLGRPTTATWISVSSAGGGAGGSAATMRSSSSPMPLPVPAEIGVGSPMPSS
jgi:GTP-binding protein